MQPTWRTYSDVVVLFCDSVQWQKLQRSGSTLERHTRVLACFSMARWRSLPTTRVIAQHQAMSPSPTLSDLLVMLQRIRYDCSIDKYCINIVLDIYHNHCTERENGSVGIHLVVTLLKYFNLFQSSASFYVLVCCWVFTCSTFWVQEACQHGFSGALNVA